MARAEITFTRPVEAVGSVFPSHDQPVHEVKAFVSSQCIEGVKLGTDGVDRLDGEANVHKEVLLCRWRCERKYLYRNI